MSDLDPADLAARFRQALVPLVRKLRTNVEEGMSPSLMSALATVAREERVTLTDLAAMEKVTPPMATKLANALEERGLVSRVACAEDKRVTRLELTKAGRAMLDRSHSRRNAWLARKLADLTEDERIAIAESIAVIERLNREDAR
jgi:DNA-binding MarR family transcriptional regulator